MFYHQHEIYPSTEDSTQENHHQELNKFITPDRKPFLFGMKARIGEQEINILLDPGSTITIMSKNLEAKLNKQSLVNRGSKTLLQTAAAECSKTRKTREDIVEIN